MHELEITQCFLYSIYFPLGLRLFPPSSPLLRSQAFYFHECDSGICWPFVGARLNSALIESYASVKGASGERNATKNRTHNTVKLPQPNRFCNDTTATVKLPQPRRLCNDAPVTDNLPQPKCLRNDVLPQLSQANIATVDIRCRCRHNQTIIYI